MSELPLVCLIEDDPSVAELYARYLEKNGYRVQTHADGADAADWVLERDPAAVLLDANLPGRDGFEVCRELRPYFEGPILMLTARDDNVDKIVGFELGADGYITKPAEPRLVLAQIKSCLRRAAGGEMTQRRKVQFGKLSVDAAARSVEFDGHEVELSTGEFDLLWLLATHAGNVVSRDDIQQALRGFGHDGIDRAIDMRISRLRKQLGDESDPPRRIKTVRARGYLLNPAAWD